MLIRAALMTLRSERGSQMPGFLTVAVFALLTALALTLASHGLSQATQYARMDAAARSLAQNTCTMVYAFGLESGTNTALRAFAGGTETVPYPVPSATPMSAVVKIAAASGDAIGAYAGAGSARQQTSCTIPSPKPTYGATQTN